VGAVLDYLLPADSDGPVTLEIIDENGILVRSFNSASPPVKASARVYFADTWLGQPDGLPATPGHHRFVWNLRYAPPPTVESQYSIAAVPGRETPVLPEGAFVLPGSYTIRLTAGGEIATQKLDVVMDPRVTVTTGELAELLEFQQQVAARLQKAVDLNTEVTRSGAVAKAESGALPEKTAAATVAAALMDLAIDLENSDLPPTTGQRQVLEYQAARLDEVETAWRSDATR
jgi:hypothetical protein